MIVLENVSKEFKTNKKYPGFKGAIKSLFSKEYTIKKAVDNISFEIKKGEIVGYIGANGAGKSTTIKMMTGILIPSSGRIIVDGIVPYEKREENAKNIGAVFGQRTQLWWDLPLSETFTLLKEIYEVSDNDFKERMEFLNEVLDLNEFMLSPVRTLSLGQRMRADLAAALIHNPKILYLDEPTIGLDVVVKEKVRTAIKQINELNETTIILTTHDLNDIEELCNRIIIIDSGKNLYDGTILNIKEKYGYMTNIEIQTKKEVDTNSLTLRNIFNLQEEDLSYTYSKEENKLKVSYNKNKVSSSDIMFHIMKDYRVIDFTVKETSIEEIIKKIYTSEVSYV